MGILLHIGEFGKGVHDVFVLRKQRYGIASVLQVVDYIPKDLCVGAGNGMKQIYATIVSATGNSLERILNFRLRICFPIPIGKTPEYRTIA